MKTLVFIALFLGQMINTGPRRKSIGYVVTPCTGCLDAWAMNEGSGSTLHDSNQSTGTNLTLSGGTPNWASNGFSTPTLGFGTPGGSGTATGGSATPTNFTGASPFTISLWVYAYNFTNTVFTLFDTTAGLTTPGIYLRKAGSGDLRWEAVFEGGAYPTQAAFVQAGGTNCPAPPFSPPAIMYNYVLTYSGTPAASSLQIYINGLACTMSTLTNNLSSTVSTTNPVIIPGAIGASGASIAYVETWGSALSGATIAANYALGPKVY